MDIAVTQDKDGRWRHSQANVAHEDQLDAIYDAVRHATQLHEDFWGKGGIIKIGLPVATHERALELGLNLPTFTTNRPLLTKTGYFDDK